MTTILTSLHGIKVGLDVDGYLTSPTGIKVPELHIGTSGSEVRVNDNTTTTATVSSTGTAISNSGITTLTSTATKTYSLADPTGVGMTKRIVQTSSSTAGLKLSSAAGSFAGSTAVTFLNFFGVRDAATLTALSTAQWGLTGGFGAVTMTTA